MPWFRLVTVVGAACCLAACATRLVYSLRQDKLVWGGQTTTTDSVSVAGLVETTARQVAKELRCQGLLPVT